MRAPAEVLASLRRPRVVVVGDLIARALRTPDDDAALAMIRQEVERLCRKFPLYPDSRT